MAFATALGPRNSAFEGRWKSKDFWLQWIIRRKAKSPGTFTLTFYPGGDIRKTDKSWDVTDLHRHGNRLTGYMHWIGPRSAREIAMSRDYVFELRGSKLHVHSTITAENNTLTGDYSGRTNEYEFVRVK